MGNPLTDRRKGLVPLSASFWPPQVPPSIEDEPGGDSEARKKRKEMKEALCILNLLQLISA